MKLYGAIFCVSGLVAMGCSSNPEEPLTTSAGGALGNGGASGAIPGQGGSAGKGTVGPQGGAAGPAGSTAKTTGAGGKTGGTTQSTAGDAGSGGKGTVGSGGKTSTSGGTAGKAGSGGTAAVGGSSPGTTTAFVPKVCPATGTLKEAAACNNKLIGAAITQGMLSNSGYAAAAGEFNFFTAENEMKWQTIEPSQGSFTWGPGQAIVDFASPKGKIKGHTTVWHSQLATWVESTSDVKGAMVKHITEVMGHWKGKIYAWDVVNEAVDVDDKKTGMGNARLRDSVFLSKVGKDYIDLAFQTAKKADPNAKLFYNDYSTEGMNDKSDFVYEMVKSMKERGIPIDGVGMQTHIGTPNDTPTADEMKQNINRLAALGLEIHLSELDINGCDGINDDKMATMYHDIVAACVQQPLCTAITVWGINDGGSWLKTFEEAGCNNTNPRSLLFTDSYQKKGTYTAVIKALTGN